ncbi:hypothetical protein TWF481_008395 [Arthrobotrys musiformis]|uniref:Uncharacterized protein n=1 Tax=Arthrobotrys musiformis TaxID=47236 RepID=A0AAV9W827_9PEZI
MEAMELLVKGFEDDDDDSLGLTTPALEAWTTAGNAFSVPWSHEVKAVLTGFKSTLMKMPSGPWLVTCPFDATSLMLTTVLPESGGGVTSYRDGMSTQGGSSSEHLSAELAVTVGYPFLKASVSGKYDKNVKEDNHRKSVPQFFVSNGPHHLGGYPSLFNVLRSKGRAKFAEIYGDYYIAGYELGADAGACLSAASSSASFRFSGYCTLDNKSESLDLERVSMQDHARLQAAAQLYLLKVFLSENPFELYQTWIHIKCLSEYVIGGAPRQFPNIESLNRPIGIAEETDEGTDEEIDEGTDKVIGRGGKIAEEKGEEEEEEEVDTGNNMGKQEPKARKRETAKLPTSASEREDDQKSFKEIYNDLYSARLALTAALDLPSRNAVISNAAAIEANGVIEEQGLMRNGYDEKIWNPLVVSISPAKIIAATGKRTKGGIKSQGSIMGSASEIATERFEWLSTDQYIIDKPTAVEGEQPKGDDENVNDAADETSAHLLSLLENKIDGAAESNTLRVNGGFHTFYVAEWLHLSAFSWGGLKMTPDSQDPKDIPLAHCKSSQIYWNLIFGTSETNSVMTRFEGAWQDLFEEEAELFRDDQGSRKDFTGWLIIEKYPPGAKYIKEDRENPDQVFYQPEGPYGSTPVEAAYKAHYPWLCYCLRYTIVIQGTSRILHRENPSFTTHFYPFTRFFFHSAEHSLDTRLFQCMKKEALSTKETTEFTTKNTNSYDKSPRLVWKPLYPGGKYEDDEFYVSARPPQTSQAYRPANKKPLFQSRTSTIQNKAAGTLISNNVHPQAQPSSQNNQQTTPEMKPVDSYYRIQSLLRSSSMGNTRGTPEWATGALGRNLGESTERGSGGDMKKKGAATEARDLQRYKVPVIISRNAPSSFYPQNSGDMGNQSFTQTDSAQFGHGNLPIGQNQVLDQFRRFDVIHMGQQGDGSMSVEKDTPSERSLSEQSLSEQSERRRRSADFTSDNDVETREPDPSSSKKRITEGMKEPLQNSLKEEQMKQSK